MSKRNDQYPNFGLIAATGQNGEIGYKNRLIWKIEEDLNFFKNVTMNAYIIMGKNTYESMPKNLPGRKYIVLSRDKDFNLETSKIVHRDIDETLDFVSQEKASPFWVVGGGIIYAAFLPYVQTMHITKINNSYHDADTYFPEFNKNEWLEKTSDDLECPENNVCYKHMLYLRKK